MSPDVHGEEDRRASPRPTRGGSSTPNSSSSNSHLSRDWSFCGRPLTGSLGTRPQLVRTPTGPRAGPVTEGLRRAVFPSQSQEDGTPTCWANDALSRLGSRSRPGPRIPPRPCRWDPESPHSRPRRNSRRVGSVPPSARAVPRLRPHPWPRCSPRGPPPARAPAPPVARGGSRGACRGPGHRGPEGRGVLRRPEPSGLGRSPATGSSSRRAR